MDTTVEDIKAKLNIVDIIGGYVRLQKSGAHFKAPCPFHHEKTPSFMVNEERQMWHCFGCNKGGDVFAFLMETEGVDFREALKILAERAGIELPKYSGEKHTGVKNRSFEILEWATKFYEKQLWDGSGKKSALKYLRERGLQDASIQEFRLGYAPNGWRYILDFLTGKGYALEEIEQTGLILRKQKSSSLNGSLAHYDRFRDRIMFPIHDVLGRVIGYSARVSPGGDESQAKYINTPETSIYRKSHALYGIQRAKQAMKQARYALLVEGNMDVIAAHQAGLKQTVAVSGTALTIDQLKIIKRSTDTVKLFFDMDGAGQTAARRSAEIAITQGFSVSIVSIDEGKDAADIAREHPEALVEAVDQSTPAFQYFLEKIVQSHTTTTPEGKRSVANDYVELVRHSPHEIDRVFWIRKLSETLDVEERVLLDIMQKVSSGHSTATRELPEQGDAAKATIAPESFEKRSQQIRRRLIECMTVCPIGWEWTSQTLSSDAKAFFRKDVIGALFLDEGLGVQFSFDALLATLSREDARRSIITGMVFEGEKLAGSFQFSDKEMLQQTLLDTIKRLIKDLEHELHREKMIRLEHAMKNARERGDIEEERRLRAEFSSLMIGEKF